MSEDTRRIELTSAGRRLPCQSRLTIAAKAYSHIPNLPIAHALFPVFYLHRLLYSESLEVEWDHV